MNTTILYRFTGLVMVLLGLQGCDSVASRNADFFAQHEQRFGAELDFQTHWIPRDGHRLHAREVCADCPGTPLILMHGFPDSLHLYDWLMPELAGTRRVIAFDFLGWGDSDKPAGHRYDADSLRRDLEAVIAHFDLPDVVLVVHDASGLPGIDWALDNPERTAGLVLLNTFYGPMPSLRAPEAIELFSTPGLERDLSVWATRNFDAIWLRRYNEQIAKFISTPALREPFQRVLGHQSLAIRPAFYGLNRVLREEVESRGDQARRLRQLSAPVRIIFGNDDPYLNAGVARVFHDLLPNSELFLVEQAGHFVQVDKPDRVADLLREFP